MKNAHKLRFEYVPQLHLLDLKAQKKNVPCKLFLNLPLTLEEEIATKTLAPVAAAQPLTSKSKNMIKIRRKKLERLALPRQQQDGMRHSESVGSLSTIISKCDRLKSRMLTNKKLVQFQRDAGKCYDYLFELSNFNFLKYEQE